MCNILVPWRSLNGSYKSTAHCKKGVKRKIWHLEAGEERAVTSRAFSAYRRPIDMVLFFKYLRRVPSAADYDCLEVVKNLVKLQTVSRRMSRIMSREGTRPRVSGFFFKVLVQSVYLFGAETWVVTPRMGRALGGFQDQVERRLTGRISLWRLYERW